MFNVFFGKYCTVINIIGCTKKKLKVQCAASVTRNAGLYLTYSIFNVSTKIFVN